MTTRKIAIACQGGGTHAAFTWGVLTEILRTQRAWDAAPDTGETFRITAISGTSAGALCALATWYGLVPNTADPTCGSIDKAIERLDFLWTVFAATTPAEIWHNALFGRLLSLKARGVPFPGTSPYDASGAFGLATLAAMGARPEYLQFAALLDAVCPAFATIDWPAVATADKRCVVGAIEVLSGNFEVFDSDKTLEVMGIHPNGPQIAQYNATRWRMRRPLSLPGVAASGTLPEILPAQRIPDTQFPSCVPGRRVVRDAYYWDGLYSQNPPIHDLLDAASKEEKPDEIWVIRINPQEIRRPKLDNVSLEDIRDRENDLAGNLALNQELDHILTTNRWLAEYGDSHPPLQNCKTVTVRTIKMLAETVWGMSHTTKFDRDKGHLARLRDEGAAIARDWLAGWRADREAFPSYPNDARYPEALDPA
jgi:NTE family protein